MLEGRNNLPVNPFLPFSGSSEKSPGPEPHIPAEIQGPRCAENRGTDSGHTDAIPKPYFKVKGIQKLCIRTWRRQGFVAGWENPSTDVSRSCDVSGREGGRANAMPAFEMVY
jgi:hypothetical protein